MCHEKLPPLPNNKELEYCYRLEKMNVLETMLFLAQVMKERFWLNFASLTEEERCRIDSAQEVPCFLPEETREEVKIPMTSEPPIVQKRGGVHVRRKVVVKKQKKASSLEPVGSYCAFPTCPGRQAPLLPLTASDSRRFHFHCFVRGLHLNAQELRTQLA